MASLGESLLTLKVDGDVFKLWWVELHKWWRYGGQKRRRWVASWFDGALVRSRGQIGRIW
jgi:hypothetical protein